MLATTSTSSVPSWAWGAMLLLFGGVITVLWWAVQRWFKRLDKNISQILSSIQQIAIYLSSQDEDFEITVLPSSYDGLPALNALKFLRKKKKKKERTDE